MLYLLLNRAFRYINFGLLSSFRRRPCVCVISCDGLRKFERDRISGKRVRSIARWRLSWAKMSEGPFEAFTHGTNPCGTEYKFLIWGSKHCRWMESRYCRFTWSYVVFLSSLLSRNLAVAFAQVSLNSSRL